MFGGLELEQVKAGPDIRQGFCYLSYMPLSRERPSS